mmetsp:Transcript_38412/g.61903  ORF Transcript_38412/g.61903 Transcript_38412/m.61903 type:complete len:146 (-) Transcript_38412:272-709(-)
MVFVIIILSSLDSQHNTILLFFLSSAISQPREPTRPVEKKNTKKRSPYTLLNSPFYHFFRKNTKKRKLLSLCSFPKIFLPAPIQIFTYTDIIFQNFTRTDIINHFLYPYRYKKNQLGAGQKKRNLNRCGSKKNDIGADRKKNYEK